MSAAVDGEELLRRMIAVLEEHFSPLRSTLLDATVSCKRCRALVLEENASGHEAWHQKQEGLVRLR